MTAIYERGLLTIGSCFSVHISSNDARGKYEEHKRSVLSKLPKYACIRTAESMNQLFYNILPMEMYDRNPKKFELFTGHSLLTPSACSTRLWRMLL